MPCLAFKELIRRFPKIKGAVRENYERGTAKCTSIEAKKRKAEKREAELREVREKREAELREAREKREAELREARRLKKIHNELLEEAMVRCEYEHIDKITSDAAERIIKKKCRQELRKLTTEDLPGAYKPLWQKVKETVKETTGIHID